MIRRILNVTLALAIAVTAIPRAASAADTTTPPADQARVVTPVDTVPALNLNLEKATRGIVLAKQQSAKADNGGFLSKPSEKMALAVGIIAACIVVGYMISKGPDPTPVPTK
jgi:hypothetical protein